MRNCRAQSSIGAELAYAVIRFAQADRTSFAAADLTCAWFIKANLREAWLNEATLISADFKGTDLTGAQLNGADLTDANFSGFEPFGVSDLTGADLAGATLTGADLTGAWWPARQPLPPGWEVDPGSHLLKRSSAGTAWP